MTATKKGPIAMIRRLFTAEREFQIAKAEADRELEACRIRKVGYRAQIRDDLDSTMETLSTIKADRAAAGE